jgi:hypothetical protein
VLTLIAIGVACGGDGENGNGNRNSYPDEVRENFMSSCTSTGGSESQCTCAWDEIVATFSFEEFTEIENELSQGRGGEELQPIIEKCLTP